MSSTETITLEILAKDLASGQIRTFVSNVDKAAKQGGIMGSVFQGVGQHVGSSIASMISPTRLLTGVLDQAGEAAMNLATGTFKQAIEGEVITARMTQALKNNVEAWDGNTAAVNEASKAAEQYGFVNDDVENSVASAVIATKNLNDAITIVTAAQDLARAKNISLESATQILTKAYNGSTTSLTRMGIKIDKTHKGLDTVRDVEKAVGDQSKTMSKTFVGRLGTMGASLSNFQEDVGAKLMPQLEGWAAEIFGIIQNVTHALDFLGPGSNELGPYDVVPKGYNEGSTTGDGGRYSRRRNRNHAGGGLIAMNDWGWSGETGMERIDVTPAGAMVTPVSGSSGARSGGDVHLHIHSQVPPTPIQAQQFAREFGPAIKSELQRLGF